MKEDCLFCGEKVQLEPDSKHPGRWDEAYLARTADRGKGRLSVKQVLRKKCDEHDSDFAEKVRTRLMSQVGDLHAMDVRYHLRCYKTFTSTRNIEYSKNVTPGKSNESDAVDSVVKLLKHNPTKSFNSIELHNEYKQNGGSVNHMQIFMEKNIIHDRKDTLSVQNSRMCHPDYCTRSSC